MAKKKRSRREVSKTDFDLMPMIDVTFQLLIFFIVTMKIKQKERREAADLPQDEGPTPTDAEPKDFIVIRLFWRQSQMTYEVNAKHGNNMGESPEAIHAGGLDVLINDRLDPSHAKYTEIFNGLENRVKTFAARYNKAEKFELSMSLDTKKSSRDQIGETAPWGYVTLVLDVLTKFNKDRTDNGLEPFTVTFKNTEPQGGPGR